MNKPINPKELETMKNAFNKTKDNIDASDPTVMFGMKILEEVFLKNSERNCKE